MSLQNTADSKQDSKAALALVSARPGGTNTTSKDDGLQRVKDLIELHGKAKSAQAGGIDQDLQQARESVAALMK